MKICSVPGCTNRYDAKGYCSMHYRRMRTNGDPLLSQLPMRGKPLIDRIMVQVEVDEHDCWLWTGRLTAKGYIDIEETRGKIRRRFRAHRVVYEYVYGPIPEGTEIDHICRRRHCVNPEHLEAVTHQENMRRAVPYHEKYGVARLPPEERRAWAALGNKARWGSRWEQV